MIQFNLLPDIKQEYIKAQRQKHLIIFISSIASVATVALLIVLILVVDVWQKKSISDLNKDIKSNSSQLSGTKDLDKILTVQNQLGSLGPLHDKKAVASRLFSYISTLTPANATISKLSVDYSKNTLNISGNADALSTVNTYVDTIKFTTYKVTGSTAVAKNAFSQVVLATFGKTNDATTYTVNATFDPAIFSEAGSVDFTVPKITTTRSAIDQPSDLFKQTGN